MSARPILLLSAAAVLLACSGGDEPGQTKTSTTAPNVVSLIADEYTFRAPDSIPAGWTSFHLANVGEEVHYGHIVQLEPGRSVQEMVQAYATAIRTSGPRPKWVTRFGGPGGTAPGDSSRVTQYLAPGRYVWICPIEDSSGNPHFAKGEFKPFLVHAAQRDVAHRSAAPEASTVIRLVDYAFALDAPLEARPHTVRVENAGVEPHDLVILKLAPGKSVEDVQRWLNPERARRAEQDKDPAPPLAGLGTVAGGIAAIAPGMEGFFEAHFTPGEYVLMCMGPHPMGDRTSNMG